MAPTLPATARTPSASGRSQHRLIADLAAIVCCKLVIILTLWVLFFSPGKRIEQSPDNVANGLLHHDRTAVSNALPHPDSASRTPDTQASTPTPWP